MKDLKVGTFCDGSIPYWKGAKIKAPKVLTMTAATSAAALTDLASKKALRLAPTSEGSITWALFSDVIFERQSQDRIACKSDRGDALDSTWRCCAFGSTLMSTGTYEWELTTSQEEWVHIGVCTDEKARAASRFERAEGSGMNTAAEDYETGDIGGTRTGCWLLGLFFNELLLDGKPPEEAVGGNTGDESQQGFTTEITVTYSESTGLATLQFVRAGKVGRTCACTL
jgi:hypothetical protein